MAIKKTISTKSTPALVGKVPAKKIAAKKSPVKKVTAPKKVATAKKAVVSKKAVVAKKVSAPKKAVAPKKAAKKEAGKIIKKLPAKLLTKTSTGKKAKLVVSPSAALRINSTKPSDAVKSTIQLLVDAAVEGVLEVKGKNIAVLDLQSIHNRVCDYYIICQADSSTQVNAIAGSVEEMVKKRIGERPYHTEGFQNSEWILVDYVNVVVHVFQSHIREFYNLEALWADAEITKIAFD